MAGADAIPNGSLEYWYSPSMVVYFLDSSLVQVAGTLVVDLTLRTSVLLLVWQTDLQVLEVCIGLHLMQG